MVFLHHSSAEKMVRNTKGGPTLAQTLKHKKSHNTQAQDGVTKGKKNAKSHTTQAQTKSRCKTKVFMVPSYLFGTALTCHFGTSMQCAQQP
jgi:hypothetical protein